jgi:membrane-bound serine protease (ClpP class)
VTALIIIAVLVVGLLLLFTEVAVLPGFGVAGFLGILALGAGAVAAWTELGPLWGGITGGFALIAAGFLVYWLPRTRAARHIVLEHSQADAVSQQDRSDLIGRRGFTVTPLRPIGRVRFGREEVDVETEGEYIESNREVEVMTVEGPRVVVRIPDAT